VLALSVDIDANSSVPEEQRIFSDVLAQIQLGENA